MTLEDKMIARINEISAARDDMLKDIQYQINLMNTTMIEIAKLLGRMDVLPEDLRPQPAPVPTPETLPARVDVLPIDA
jgi:hypothetical protein